MHTLWTWCVIGALALAPDANAEAPASKGIDPVAVDVPEGLEVGKYIAVIFTSEQYASGSGLPALKTPNNDARAIGEVLRDQYAFDVRLKLDADRATILTTLRALGDEVGEDDVVVIYYGGHGWYDVAEDRGYWMPVGSSEDDDTNWVSTDDVAAKVRALPARHVLVIVDSCFSGSLLTKGGAPEVTGGTPTLTEAAAVMRDRSRMVITSGGLGPVADGEGMSVFARSLVHALTTTESTYVLPDRVFPIIRSEVVAETKATTRQTPLMGRILGDGAPSHGQVVLLNRGACLNAANVKSEAASLASSKSWEESVLPFQGIDPRKHLAAVDRWIDTWKDATVAVCGEDVSFEVPRMREAIDLRRRLAWGTSRTRQIASKTAAVGGAAMTVAGASLVTSSQLWLRQQDYTQTGGLVLYEDAEFGEEFRRQRLLNYLGGSLASVGGGLLLWGSVDLMVHRGDRATIVAVALEW